MRQTEVKKLLGVNPNPNQTTGDMPSTCLRYGLGRYSVEQLAQAAGAKIRVGRRVVYNWKKMDAYMDSISE